MKIILGFVLLLAAAGAGAGEVYKWTDEKGRVHYGDRPRQKDAQKVSVSPGSGDGGTEAARAAGENEKLKLQDKRYADCKERREKLANFKVASQVVEKDGLGNERTYSDEEKAKLIERTQAALERDCTGV